MRTVDRMLAFVCAVTAVFALSFAAGRIVGPVGPGVDQPRSPSPSSSLEQGSDDGH